MDWRDYLGYRWHAAAAAALLILAAWYTTSFRPKQEALDAAERRRAKLSEELIRLEKTIETERENVREAPPLPKRFTPTFAAALPRSERLQHFLRVITERANRRDLKYVAVTPKEPKQHSGYEELPFSISVTGTYPGLARYLYELEYHLSFVMRSPIFTREGEDGSVRAEFELAALLFTAGETDTPPPDAEAEDPGEPTAIELARNPFARPPARLATGPDGRRYFLNVLPGFHLGGLMRVRGHPVAIINREPYREGDTIEGKTITSITDRGVELRDEVRTYFLEAEQASYPSVDRDGKKQEASSP